MAVDARARHLIVLSMGLVLACDPESGPDVGPDGSSLDSGSLDATVTDATVTDATAPDAMRPDAAGLDVGLVDFHTHCFQESCDTRTVAAETGGDVFVLTAALQHYAIAEPLGDPIPSELAGVARSNAIHAATAEGSDRVGLLASLECLSDTPGSDSGWVAACAEDADRWLAAGALGFKDHAGKAHDDSELDLALWVGAYNRYAGFCEVDPESSTPNADCLEAPGFRFPLAVPAWREMVREIVEVRRAPLLTHTTPFSGTSRMCSRLDGSMASCHTVAVEALLDFVDWAERELSAEARRRIVLAHLAFLQNDEVRLRRVLDAGFTVDLAQTELITMAGCRLRELAGLYPRQIVLGTDIDIGASCRARSWEAWRYTLEGPAGVERVFSDTCRGTMRPVGAELDEPGPTACDLPIPSGTGERVRWRNALELLDRR